MNSNLLGSRAIEGDGPVEASRTIRNVPEYRGARETLRESGCTITQG